MHTIGAAARLSGVHVETIRYYEREGVVSLPARSSSGRRLYTEREIMALRFVKRCRDLGFPVEDIKVLLTFPNEGPGVCADVKAVAEMHLYKVRAKIADLIKLETALVQLIEPCGADNADCPALRRLFLA